MVEPPQKAQPSGDAMPPGYHATVELLQVFTLSSEDMGSAADPSMGEALVAAWQQDGILKIAMDAEQQTLYKAAKDTSKRFFRKPFHQKAACIDSQSYSGYIANGEELTDGLADYSEIFTVTKGLDLDDPRASAKWPCHGSCPWPDADLRDPVKKYIDSFGQTGKKLLRLIELGINVPEGSLTRHYERRVASHANSQAWAYGFFLR
ncbi:putative ethylene-forming enzyme [Dactylonectria macrodidyma]|uniref:Ethylene-forming enzyme n=1 Tax=Dactylonectria macrodidyma TaxID=307937 RepID=A0A9P9E5C7_9HYPO|nr:putative ethylene-forming enzyme [Dactylonectria macrodidyma]